MSHPSVVIDLDALLQVEAGCRERLREDPCDYEARISLAWCLFTQSLHRAGQESVVGALTADCMVESQSQVGRYGSRDRDAAVLLSESLRQACRVKQLSVAPRQQMETTLLQNIARAAVGSQVMAQAEARSDEAVVRMLRSLETSERGCAKETVRRGSS